MAAPAASGWAARRRGQPQPAVLFGKGLGDATASWLRPLAVTGFAGFQLGEGTRPNLVNLGLGLQYSLPYLVSKVSASGLPAWAAGLSLTFEFLLSTPATHGSARTTVMAAPGFSYTQGEGWEFGIEALVPSDWRRR